MSDELRGVKPLRPTQSSEKGKAMSKSPDEPQADHQRARSCRGAIQIMKRRLI